MQYHLPERRSRPGSVVVILFPCLFIIVLLMHFQGAAEFFKFKWRSVPSDPQQVVSSLVRAQNHGSMFRDPHILGYLSLPLLLFCAVSLYQLSCKARPRLSSIAIFVTVSGTIYFGGFFGMWTAFYRGLGSVDPRYLEGAVETFRGMTAPSGAFLLTTLLAKISFVGLGAQGLLLWRLPGIPRRSAVLIPLGCLLILAFWALPNWMLMGMVLIMIGFVPLIPLWSRLDCTSSQPRTRDEAVKKLDGNGQDVIS